MTTLPLSGAETTSDVSELGLVASLQERLAESLAALRRRSGSPAALESRIALVGGLLLSAGAVVVLLGWYGAAHTSRVYLQIPYLISGGLFGVVLAFAGGCTYLASWITRLVHDQQARADEAVAAAQATAAALGRIEALLASGSSSEATVAVTASNAAAQQLVSTPAGKLAHRPSCPTVAGRTDLRPAVAGPDGLTLCSMCS